MLYAVLLIFSIILMGITAGRISNTERAASFYESSVAELLVVSILLIGVSTFFGIVILTLREGRHITRLYFECIVLAILWLMLLVGAAVATSIFPNLNLCIRFSQCRLLQAMLGFAWMCWIILTFLLGVSLAYAIRTRRWDDHMHSWNGWNSGANGPAATVRA